MRKLTARLALLVVCPFLSSCTGTSPEEEFLFNHYGVDERGSQFQKLPMEQQYKVYRYGTQRMHPPLKDLGRLFAKHGKVGLYHMLADLEDSENVLDFVNSIGVFVEMQRRGYYSICEDQYAMEQVRMHLGKMRAMRTMWLDNFEWNFQRLEEQCD